MKVGILAGGLGTRLAEETEVKPKPMVEIGGRPIMWHIMKHFMHHGLNEFVVALGYKGEHIKRYLCEYYLYNAYSNIKIDLATGNVQSIDSSVQMDCIVDLIETGDTTETSGRIRRILPYMGNETFIVTYGDGVSDVDVGRLVEFHKSHGRLATLTAVHPPNRFGKVDLEDDRVVRFVEKPQFAGEAGPQVGEGWVSGGYFVLEPGVVEFIDDDTTKFELGPIERLAKEGELMAYRHYSFWQCMDTIRDKKLLESLWESGDRPWVTWE
jgi:glucose-1-phosphate cytidylyltransferase